MTAPGDYIKYLLTNKGYNTGDKKEALFTAFVSDEANREAATTILKNQQLLMDKWHINSRVHDVMQQQIMIPNATVNKSYAAILDLEKLNLGDLALFEFEDLGAYGLAYDAATRSISGTPTVSGDLKLKLKFRIAGEEETTGPHEKTITFIINPDPKSLWKNMESDKNDPYYKADEATAFGPLGGRHIVAASKRGRSHANTGAFRDDDFAYTHFKHSGWSLVAVADGAGSARLSRKGSAIACQSLIAYFEAQWQGDVAAQADALITAQHAGTGDALKQLDLFIYNTLGQAALYVHKQLEQFAAEHEAALKDLHSTLIFTLFKPFSFGCALLTFGVGDCVAGALNKDLSQVTVLNRLDVGEFGGGTRFITMPEIFNSDRFSSRFSFKLVKDLCYLFLMTDGIYDPKFSVEANLEKPGCWQEFITDLQGRNADNFAVDINKDNVHIEQQLLQWMDFWSPGNHDDRTLAIIF